MKQPILAFLLLAIAGACTVRAQSAMDPAGTGGENPGFSAFSKERPKNAETVITAQEEATFDNKTSIAEFTGSVVVKDPQFTLTCDRLRAYLKPGGKGLEKVEAIGNVVIRQENTDSRGGDVVSVARSGVAVFVPATGDIELRESPQIAQGINAHVATEPQTRMILNRAGKINTIGGSKTVIIDSGEAMR